MWRQQVGILCSALPQGVVVLDRELRIVVANRAASSLFDLRPERLRGRLIATVVPHNNFGGLLKDVREAPRVIEVVLPRQRDGAIPSTVRITAVPLGDWDAATDRRRSRRRSNDRFTLLVIEDISDKALLEQQIVETEKQVAMGQLAAGILHEISNPLVSIASNLLFVRGALTTTATSDIVQALDVSLEHLSLMRELLGTLSSLPARAAPRYRIADLQEVVRRCATLMAKELEQRQIRLGLDAVPSVITCEIDVRLIKQVLINLMKNAMEAMPDGGCIYVRSRYEAAPRDRYPANVVIEVADTGIGIPEPDLRKVFRPLFSTKPRGAGLGLSFCRQVVEEHGGSIRLASGGTRQGTVVTIILPISQTPNGD